MPYAALPIVNGATRLTLANARWAAMLASKPELGAAVALQRRLIGLVIDLTEQFGDRPLPRLSLPPRYLTAKLKSGIPALTGEPMQMPVETIRPTLLGLTRALAEGGGGEATVAIRSAFEEGRLDVAPLLGLAMRREQAALRTFATRAGLGHDLLWLVLDLAVSPFAHALLESAFGDPEPGSPLRLALDAWGKGYCPLCGSWPVLVEDVESRRLRCSFCAAAWELAERSCVYCGDAGEQFAVLTPDPARPRRVVELCGSCRGYTKVVPAESSVPFPVLALADLESMDLDMSAMQRGCARPAIKQFPRRQP